MDTPYRWREQVESAQTTESRRGLRKGLLNESKVLVTAVRQGPTEKLGVTSTVLGIVTEQLLKRYRSEKKLSRT